MFMLYAILIGLVAGVAAGGRPSRLAELRLAWIPLAVAAMLVQTVLFMPEVWAMAGGLTPVIYIASTALAMAVVVRNLRRAWALWLVALGTACNLLAIVSNGGFMPVTAEALGVAAPAEPLYGGNSVLKADPTLALLVDRFALPDWLPFATIFSVGDVLISVGLVLVVALGMRTSRHANDSHEPSGTKALPIRPGADGGVSV